MRSLWASVELKPRFMLWLNGIVTLILIPWTILLVQGMPLADLGEQVWYVTLISHVALILSGLSAFQAARVEVRQEAEEKRRLEEDAEDMKELLDAVRELRERI